MKKDMYLLSRKIYRYQTITNYQRKAEQLGYSKIDKFVFSFLNARLGFSILLFCFTFLIWNNNPILAFLTAILFYYGFTYYLFDYRISKRARKLEKEAIYFFEVFALSLESGKSLIQGLKLTVSNVDNELSKEIGKSIREIDYGKSLPEAFTDLRVRIPSNIVQNVMLNIVEAYTSGGNIVITLRKQIDFIQNKRITDLKTEMNKIPIKISIVSVFLFIPLILLLILAPVILEYFG